MIIHFMVQHFVIPECQELLAEAMGVLFGDGNSYLYVKGNKSTYTITITCNIVTDRDYHETYLPRLFNDLFNLKFSRRQLKNTKGIQLRVSNKALLYYLWSLGFPPGDKIKNKIRIPDWILQNNKFAKEFIKGFIDTDGSVYELLPHWPGLFQISFCNKNIFLL